MGIDYCQTCKSFSPFSFTISLPAFSLSSIFTFVTFPVIHCVGRFQIRFLTWRRVTPTPKTVVTDSPRNPPFIPQTTTMVPPRYSSHECGFVFVLLNSYFYVSLVVSIASSYPHLLQIIQSFFIGFDQRPHVVANSLFSVM